MEPKLRDQTQASRLAGEIADAIVTGVFRPGAKLDEQRLAERYDVSRTPVREAIRQLATTGLIETRPRRSAVVAAVTAERLEELFVAMGELEATTARLAALRMSPLERRRLAALHARMGEEAASGGVETYAEANALFHATIYAGAHNLTLSEMAHSLRRRLSPYRRAQFRAEGRLLKSHREHGAVVDAIVSGNSSAAHAAMLEHVGLVEEAFDALLRGISSEA